MVNIGNDWDDVLREEFSKGYYLNLRQFLKKEYSQGTVYPPMNDIFNAFRYTPYQDVKVVILGQDPYHEPGQAHGFRNPHPSRISSKSFMKMSGLKFRQRETAA